MKKKPDDISQIEERIAKFKSSQGPKPKSEKREEFEYAAKTGFRVTTEMLSGVVIGAGIGYFLDKVLETKPFLLIVFLFLGAAAGFLNVYRFVRNAENGEKE